MINQKEQEANTNHKKATIFNLVLGKEALTPFFKKSNFLCQKKKKSNY